MTITPRIYRRITVPALAAGAALALTACSPDPGIPSIPSTTSTSTVVEVGTAVSSGGDSSPAVRLACGYGSVIIQVPDEATATRVSEAVGAALASPRDCSSDSG
ncbi:hypothetical protein [uncultured Corynebacterium sp.]|uniref:hypothetical protein n=1 Tax=uncultured Corynebacterium sp. TaxID=159447 RepID=UPI0025E7F9F7|nr:hypothetical protein [uncultured Corynebacterium sp.]